MNYITRQIMARFGLDAEQALEVQETLDIYFSVDYSEASQRELNRAYDDAYAYWTETKVTA